MKRICIIFLFAFLANVIWENIHSYLYASYKGGEITQFILVRASLFDALVITVLLVLLLRIYSFKKRVWVIIVLGTIIAIFNEWYGLSTDRWAYNAYMPIIPLLETGLTPTIQLGFLSYVTYKFQRYVLPENSHSKIYPQ